MVQSESSQNWGESAAPEYDGLKTPGSPNEDCKKPEPQPSFFLKEVPVYEEQDPFQHYHFISVAGRGGYATVYMVEHLESGIKYACKIIHTRETPARFERALKEACMQSILSEHPNVTTLKEVWTHGLTHVFLIMERCEAGEIFDAIVSRGALPEKDAASVMRVVLQLIRYCYSKSIIHHDLKPENFMLKDKEMGIVKNNVRAVDFGCSAFYDEPTKKLSGTPLYSAPEIIKGPHHDHRADLWSAGVILFCMLTGLMPFEGETNQDLKKAVLEQEIDFEEDPWPFVSSEAKDLCKRLLRREADERILLDEALSHPWLKSQLLDFSEPYQLEILERLQNFRKLSAMEKLLMLLYSLKLEKSHEEFEAFFSIFDWMDRDGDGKLTVNDFRQGLTGFGLQISDQDPQEMFTAISQTNEDCVTFAEFQAAVIDRQEIDESSTLETLIADSSKCEKETAVTLERIKSSIESFGVCLRDDFVQELESERISNGNSCESDYIKRTWNFLKHNSQVGNHRNNCSDCIAVDLELQEVWRRAKNRRTEEDSHSSLAGSSPVRGGSPSTESSWDKMKLIRGSSPATVGYLGSDCEGASPKATQSFQTWDSSNTTSNFPEKEESHQFCSGGIVYWDGRESSHERVESDEDSDNLYGAALAAFQANHQ